MISEEIVVRIYSALGYVIFSKKWSCVLSKYIRVLLALSKCTIFSIEQIVCVYIDVYRFFVSHNKYNFWLWLFIDMMLHVFTVFWLSTTAHLIFAESINGERVTNEVMITFNIEDYQGESIFFCFGYHKLFCFSCMSLHYIGIYLYYTLY